MSDYYDAKDLAHFGDIGKYRKDLFDAFMKWYQATLQDGALTRREKALIGLGVAHTIQCPYCIDSFSQSCLESGSNMEQMTEAIHVASAIRGGAACVSGPVASECTPVGDPVSPSCAEVAATDSRPSICMGDETCGTGPFVHSVSVSGHGRGLPAHRTYDGAAFAY